MKTKEELSALKAEYETLANKLKELNGDELKSVLGGTAPLHCYDGNRRVGYYGDCRSAYKDKTEDCEICKRPKRQG